MLPVDLRRSALLICGDLREILFPGLLMQDSRCFTQIYADYVSPFSVVCDYVEIRFRCLSFIQRFKNSKIQRFNSANTGKGFKKYSVARLARMSRPCKEFDLSRFKRLLHNCLVKESLSGESLCRYFRQIRGDLRYFSATICEKFLSLDC